MKGDSRGTFSVRRREVRIFRLAPLGAIRVNEVNGLLALQQTDASCQSARLLADGVGEVSRSAASLIHSEQRHVI